MELKCDHDELASTHCYCNFDCPCHKSSCRDQSDSGYSLSDFAPRQTLQEIGKANPSRLPKLEQCSYCNKESDKCVLVCLECRQQLAPKVKPSTPDLKICADVRYCVRCLERDPPVLGKLIGDDPEICTECEGYAKYAHDSISGRILLNIKELLESENK